MKSAQKRAILGAIAGTGLAAGIFGCPASFPDVGPFGPVDDGGETDGQIIPPGCDLTKDPKDSAACVDDSIGIFVSSSGSNSSAGTKASPLNTITAALAKVDSQHSRIYVCDGTYAETVKVTKSVGLYGAFSCTDWSSDNTKVKVGPTGAGYALDIEGVGGSGVTVEDFELDSQNGVNPGDSSIAIFVANSTVTLKRVNAVAGNGVSGADAIAVSNYPDDAGAAPTGYSVDAGDVGAPQCLQTCADTTTSTGGKGGDSNAAGANGGPIIPPFPDSSHDGAGAQSSAGSCSTVAHGGATASAADGGALAAVTPGHVTASGWSSTQGASGATAGPGQGGGGGGGGSPPNGAGGSGGCGGCGGAGGAGGNAGGSSFAMLLYQATLTIDTCSLQAGTAGDGNVGGAGQMGQNGGTYGNQFLPGGTGCQGGLGGKGGAGAGGGGGAGGNSIAIGYVGTKPATTSVTMSEGTAGASGPGGAGAAGNDGLSGAPGMKADVQELP